MGTVFNVFPLLSISVLIYNLMAIGATQVQVLERLNSAAMTLPMTSDVSWVMSWGDVLILLSLMLLFVELLKSTSTGTSAILNHAMSMILFIVCLIEFLLFQGFATSVFFLIMVMTLLDVLAGVVVTIVSARRDVAVAEPSHR
jgi:hypothetical protein